MRYIESDSTNPYYNLALEEYVFNALPKDESCFMLWQNENTIVIGKYQNTMEEINQHFVDANQISVVRRLSGGGAVYHDRGNLNFTFIVDQEQAPELNFKVFAEPVVRALERLGIEAHFNGRNDLTIHGKKFSGNSQYVRQGRILHHGCIMVESNLTQVADALRVKEAKFTSKNAKSVRSRVTTINENAPAYISMEIFRQTLKEEIFGSGFIEPYELTELDQKAIRKLQKEKYETWEWNYGRASQYAMVREEKFPAGLVTVHLAAKDGRIEAIKFYGDFFGNAEIEDLEKALTGAALDQNLVNILAASDLDEYMKGITPEELSQLIRG